MTTRRNRQTGTRVTVYRDGPQWFTICEDHRQAAEHYTGRAAREWAAAPATWCTSCSEELDARELDTVEPAEIIRPTWCTTCETVHAAARVDVERIREALDAIGDPRDLDDIDVLTFYVQEIREAIETTGGRA